MRSADFPFLVIATVRIWATQRHQSRYMTSLSTNQPRNSSWRALPASRPLPTYLVPALFIALVTCFRLLCFWVCLCFGAGFFSVLGFHACWCLIFGLLEFDRARSVYMGENA
jgi:hypothetical protein